MKIWGEKNYQDGVTLIELLVSVFLSVIVLTVMGVFFNFFFDSYYFAYDSNRNIDQAKFALDKLSSEVREARKSEEGAYPLETAGDDEIVFYSDADNDGQVERLRYYLEGAELKRSIIQPGELPVVYDPSDEEISTVTDFIRNDGVPIFSYYNSSWPSDTENNPLDFPYRLLETRLVGIRLIVNVGQTSNQDLVIATKAMVRNLQTNY